MTLASIRRPTPSVNVQSWIHPRFTRSGPLLLLEPGVPEVEVRDRAEVAPQLLADQSEREHIAELDPPHVLVEEGLDTVDDGFPLPHVRLPGQFAEESVLLIEAPPAGKGASRLGAQRWIES